MSRAQRRTRPAVATTLALTTLLLGACQSDGGAGDAVPAYGDEPDNRFAAVLWQSLERAGLSGAGTWRTRSYRGRGPHGEWLQRLDGLLKVDGSINPVVVLSSHRRPQDAPQAVAVMYRRPASGGWFWASFAAHGGLLTDPDGRTLAGRINRAGGRFDCTGCHRAAPGGDYVFAHNRYR